MGAYFLRSIIQMENVNRFGDHFTEYDAISKEIGLYYLLGLLDFILGSVYRHKPEKWETDKNDFPHLNHIALRRWESCHSSVMHLAVRRKAGWGETHTAWSLNNTVCTLKHVAKYYWNPGRLDRKERGASQGSRT